MAEPKKRDGVEYIGSFPSWYDERGSMMISGGVIIIAHPEHPPHVWNMLERRWDEVRPS